jgi:hypothetical protein
MALLQVRNFPEDTYATVSKLASAERRTIAQQTILLIEKGLACGEVVGERRRRAIERSIVRTAPSAMKNLDFAALVREDRDR